MLELLSARQMYDWEVTYIFFFGEVIHSSAPALSYLLELVIFHSSSVAQSCPTLCNPMDWSTPGLPVHHDLPEATHIHVD